VRNVLLRIAKSISDDLSDVRNFLIFESNIGEIWKNNLRLLGSCRLALSILEGSLDISNNNSVVGPGSSQASEVKA
jgi:hypothetical protein